MSDEYHANPVKADVPSKRSENLNENSRESYSIQAFNKKEDLVNKKNWKIIDSNYNQDIQNIQETQNFHDISDIHDIEELHKMFKHLKMKAKLKDKNVALNFQK